ncbi:MAG: Rieske (2Fe-2S) protein [Sporichthyaceae bacterium]
MRKVSLGPLRDLAVGELRQVDHGQVGICLVRLLSGEVHALGAWCSHEEVELADGDLDGDEVVCPAHGAAFDVHTGAPSCLPATTPVAVYPVSIEAGEIIVQI